MAKGKMMITVHHLGVSQSERVVWLCEELELPYELVRYERTSAGLGPAAYKALHPMGTAPVITDGNQLLAESGAIVEYILLKYGKGRLMVGSDDPQFANYLFWFHFANGSMMPNEMSNLIFARLPSENDSPLAEWRKARRDSAFALAERRLAEAPYFGGAAFTAADIMMLFPLTTMRAFTKRDLSVFPGIRAYLARIGQRPAYRRAMSKGDPGMPLLLD
jgi:glutathione S-transferase